MPCTNNQFVMSTEQECLTSMCAPLDVPDDCVERFFNVMAELAPTLPAVSGIFNGYGRIYFDCGHLELAAAECDSPYLLAQIVERQQRLVFDAVSRLRKEGIDLLLANNNHSGVLHSTCPTWGSHENYMTERHPMEFGDKILPFLTTRIFAGAGGIEYPNGRFLAAVRPVRMELPTGGGTTGHRAIHSTEREEHHMGPDCHRFRYHQILGDGHRSQFNTALQFGATALALKAIFFDRQLSADLEQITPFPPEDSWVALLCRLNVLALPGEPLQIDPLILQTQRVYWNGARRYADSLREIPTWIPNTLRDWDQTLTAMERLDRPWLASRLDTFAKYEFFSAILREMGETWEALPNCRELFNELALLDHSYHEFCNAKSVFDRLERAGLLEHRVGAQTAPGQEAESFVPETRTRARTRARFIRDNAKRPGLVVDWSFVQDLENNQKLTLFDPFAEQFITRRDTPSTQDVLERIRSRQSQSMRDSLLDMRRAFDPPE